MSDTPRTDEVDSRHQKEIQELLDSPPSFDRLRDTLTRQYNDLLTRHDQLERELAVARKNAAPQDGVHEKQHGDTAPAVAAPMSDTPRMEGFYKKLWKDFCSLQSGDVQQLATNAMRYRFIRETEMTSEVEHALHTTRGSDFDKEIDTLIARTESQ